MSKNICIITGSRAEYGIFYPLLSELKKSDFFNVRIVTTGAHFSPMFGSTYREIEDDGFQIDENVEMNVSDNTEIGMSKSVGFGIIGFADLFSRKRPDVVIVLGDRFEIFAASVAAYIAKVPIVHLYGGETTKGAVDEAFRHSITKMSCLHFTSTEEYRKRVVQLGEPPNKVFNVGSLSIDNIKKANLLSKRELEKELDFCFGDKTALVTFHPVTLDGNDDSGRHFKELLQVLDGYRGLKIIFTKANADAYGMVINGLIDDYADKNRDRTVAVASLGRKKYHSVLNYVDVVIGNSSSGIAEAPSFHIPTVNIGDRQSGRVKVASIIDCKPRKADIEKAISKALSADFRNICKKVENPLGDGHAAEKIVSILMEQIEHTNVKKDFWDINININGELL